MTTKLKPVNEFKKKRKRKLKSPSLSGKFSLKIGNYL